MKTHLVTRDAATPESVAGRVLSHEIRGDRGDTIFHKGQRLTDADAAPLLALTWSELHLIEPEEDEVHEEQAGERIARAAAGDGVEVGALSGGHWPLTATRRGVLGVAVKAMRRANGIDGVCVYSLYDGQIVDTGELLARAKITPFVIKETRLRKVEALASESEGLLRVRGFRPLVVGAVVQETLGERAMEKFQQALAEKVQWFGGRLLAPRFVRPTESAVVDAIDNLLADGAQIIAMAGTKAMDPLDPAFRALETLGVPLERFGVPAHPGSLLWMAYRYQVPLIGMPTCGLFSQATVFDLILPRLFAGERVAARELAALGHGGLLTRDLSFRFPPYRASKERGEVE